MEIEGEQILYNGVDLQSMTVDQYTSLEAENISLTVGKGNIFIIKQLRIDK